jgi:hypothetical protein
LALRRDEISQKPVAAVPHGLYGHGMGKGLVAALAAVLALAGLPAAALGDFTNPNDYCFGDASYPLSAPKPASFKLRFGIYPIGQAGQLGPVGAAGAPEDAVKRQALVGQLSGGKPFVEHFYASYTGPGSDVSTDGQLSELEADTAAGSRAEMVLRYAPTDGGSAGDVAGFVQFVRQAVQTLGPSPNVVGIQVTNEANLPGSQNSSDGAYTGAEDALIKGVIGAKAEAVGDGYTQLKIGFNWFSRTAPGMEENFWSYLAANGGSAFVKALDWVGLDAYPGTFWPPAVAPDGTPGDARAWMVNEISTLRCYMGKIGVPKATPIWVMENGWPTGPGRSEAQQAQMLSALAGAANDYRGTYNVTDYRWFGLRDADSTSPNFQQQFGLVHTDYTAKPAFASYQALIAAAG